MVPKQRYLITYFTYRYYGTWVPESERDQSKIYKKKQYEPVKVPQLRNTWYRRVHNQLKYLSTKRTGSTTCFINTVLPYRI